MTHFPRLTPLLVSICFAACDRTRPASTKQVKAANTLKQAIDRSNVEAGASRIFDGMYRWGDVDMLLEQSHRRLIQASGGEAGALRFRRLFQILQEEIQFGSGFQKMSISAPPG